MKAVVRLGDQPITNLSIAAILRAAVTEIDLAMQEVSLLPTSCERNKVCFSLGLMLAALTTLEERLL